MKFLLTLWIAKFVAFAVNLIDKQRGSNYSGKIALKLMPDFVKGFKGIDYDKVIFISGTNGKSTTTNLVYHTLSSAGKQVAANLEGANMMGGVATTLIKNSSMSGKFNKEILLLETDERSFPLIHKVLPGRHMGLTNLQKDQVQRNGDPNFILRKFQNSVTDDMTLYLNNEEPRSSSLAQFAGSSKYFSVQPNDRSYQDDDFYAVTMPCPMCGHPIHYKQYNLSNIGTFFCTKCDHASKDEADVVISAVDYHNNTFQCDGLTWNVPYNNPFYIYNFAMCIAICHNFGLTDEQIQSAFASFKNPASHANVLHYKGKEIHYLRGKQENPDALQSQLDIIANDPRKKALYIGLYPVSDFYPHYSGSFYFFDCTVNAIVKAGVEKCTTFTKSIANDLANRMILAGIPEENISIKDTNDLAQVFDGIEELDTDVVYILTNTVHAKQIKSYFYQGGATNEEN